MTLKKPYFMSNPEWFYFDKSNIKYKLTDKAPQKAKEDYEIFYKILLKGKKNNTAK